MRTQDGDQIIINIVGHDPDGAINATTIHYMQGGSLLRPLDRQLSKLRLALSDAIRQWSREIAKEQSR